MSTTAWKTLREESRNESESISFDHYCTTLSLIKWVMLTSETDISKFFCINRLTDNDLQPLSSASLAKHRLTSSVVSRATIPARQALVRTNWNVVDFVRNQYRHSRLSDFLVLKFWLLKICIQMNVYTWLWKPKCSRVYGPEATQINPIIAKH